MYLPTYTRYLKSFGERSTTFESRISFLREFLVTSLILLLMTKFVNITHRLETIWNFLLVLVPAMRVLLLTRVSGKNNEKKYGKLF